MKPTKEMTVSELLDAIKREAREGEQALSTVPVSEADRDTAIGCIGAMADYTDILRDRLEKIRDSME